MLNIFGNNYCDITHLISLFLYDKVVIPAADNLLSLTIRDYYYYYYSHSCYWKVTRKQSYKLFVSYDHFPSINILEISNSDIPGGIYMM